MKNAGMAGAVALVGVGLITIGLGNFVKAPQAMAAPAVAMTAGPEEPTIVWYDVVEVTKHVPPYANVQGGTLTNVTWWHIVYRGWSDGTIERKAVETRTSDADNCSTILDNRCESNWVVISSPTEGLNAAADINFDEIVDGADMGLLLGNWGKAPRSPIPASDCPLGLMQ